MAQYRDDEPQNNPTLDITDGGAPKKPQKSDPTKAVALKYDKENDPAPRIVASGKGAVADQILTLAFANGVKVRKDADLVEVLETLDVDSVIPLEAFAAVAEILSYVYKANAIYGKKS
jgi:flagellar biosynthesis protein